MNVDYKKLVASDAYKQLKACVMSEIARDYDIAKRHPDKSNTDEKKTCFNPGSCPHIRACYNSRCRKVRWVIDRATHYAIRLGLSVETVLTAWESHRSYWYVNYYQDSNQPKLKRADVKIFETEQQLKDFVKAHTFVCPACGKVTTHPTRCSNKGCKWTAYGLLGTLGKGIYLVDKENVSPILIFDTFEKA